MQIGATEEEEEAAGVVVEEEEEAWRNVGVVVMVVGEQDVVVRGGCSWRLPMSLVQYCFSEELSIIKK